MGSCHPMPLMYSLEIGSVLWAARVLSSTVSHLSLASAGPAELKTSCQRRMPVPKPEMSSATSETYASRSASKMRNLALAALTQWMKPSASMRQLAPVFVRGRGRRTSGQVVVDEAGDDVDAQAGDPDDDVGRLVGHVQRDDVCQLDERPASR